MTVEEQIEKMYASSLDSQKAQLETDYAKANEELAQQQKKVQQQTKANLTRTAVESQKAAANNAELYNAYGLSSGAMAQARLAQENQLQADLTALRAVQQQTDADAERQRTLLSQEYASAIRQAQAENDLAKAQALYERAALEEERLHQKQLAAEQAQAASQQAALEQQLAAAKFVAQETGDYSMYGALLGWSSEYIKKLNGENTSPRVDNASGTGVTMTDTGAIKNNVGYYRNPLGLAGAEGYSAAVSKNVAETGAIQEAIRSGVGFTGSTYKDAVSYLNVLGVNTSQLFTKNDWQKAKKDGVSTAAVTGYATYEDYLRGYVAYAEAKKKGQIT